MSYCIHHRGSPQKMCGKIYLIVVILSFVVMSFRSGGIKHRAGCHYTQRPGTCTILSHFCTWR